MKISRSANTILSGFAFIILAFLYLPIAVLVVFSFDNSRFAVDWHGFTLKWYGLLFQDEALGLAIKNSLIVAVIAVAVSTIMGTMAAIALSQGKFQGKSFVEGLLIVPIIVPEIALAVSVLVLFLALGLPLGLTSIIVSHIIFCLSYVTLLVMARIEDLNPQLLEAALDLGASEWTVYRRIVLPLIAPGIISGALLAFVLSFDDFIITQFTAGVGATTLPLRIYSMVKFGVSPEINALSTLMLIATAIPAVLAEHFRTRQS